MQAAMQPSSYVSYGPGLPHVATPVPAVTVESAVPRHEVGFNPQRRRTMTVLSGLQIAIGISCIIIYIVLICMHHRPMGLYHLDKMGAGIWCGALYIIAGSLGVAAACQNRRCLVISSMVFSILSTLMLSVVVNFAAVAINIVQDYSYTNYNIVGHQAADSILLILSIIEFVVSIWCSVLCCKESCKACCSSCNGSCCTCCSYDSSYQAPVFYAPMHSVGQQIICVQRSGTVGNEAIGILPIQSCYMGIQQPVQVAHPAASALAPPTYQSAIAGLPEYSATQIGNAAASGAANGQHGEVQCPIVTRSFVSF